MDKLIKTYFQCQCCGNGKNDGHKVTDFYKGYGYLCEDCFNNAVMSDTGSFSTKSSPVRRATKKAGHDCWTTFSINTTNRKLRSYLFANFKMTRLVTNCVSNETCGTWQISKVADFIEENFKGTEIKVHFTKKQNGRIYENVMTVDKAIELIRNVSAIGYLTNKAIAKYELKSRPIK